MKLYFVPHSKCPFGILLQINQEYKSRINILVYFLNVTKQQQQQQQQQQQCFRGAQGTTYPPFLPYLFQVMPNQRVGNLNRKGN